MVATSVANAQVMGILGKGAKATSGRAAATALTKAQVITLAGGLGAGAIYIEVNGGKVLFKALDEASSAVTGTADDLLNLSKQARGAAKAGDTKFVISHESLDELGEQLDHLMREGQVFVADPVAGPLKLVVEATVAGRRAFKQLRPGILTPTESHITEEVLEMLDASASSEKISVVSMFAQSDVDSVRKLASAAGDRLLADATRDQIFRSRNFDELKGKTVFIVGHIEDGKFVARSANGSISHAIEIEALEKMAADANVSMIGAGCSSFCFGSKAGFAKPITDTAAVDGVREALKAETFGEMLGAFGKDKPLIVSQETLEGFAESRRIELAHDVRWVKGVSNAAIGMKIVGHVKKPLIDKSTREGLLAWFAIGAIAFLCMFNTNREAFIRSYPVLPAPTTPSSQIWFGLCWLLREAIFLAFSPVFMAVLVISWFFGGWQYRRQLLGFFWSFIARPFEACFMLVAGVVSVALYFAAYLVVGGTLISLGIGMIQLTALVPDYPHPMAIVVVLLCFLYWLVAIYAFYKFHRKLNDWMSDSKDEKSSDEVTA